ncbi:MAG: type IV secretion system protein [Plesiomonas shigelloides]
MDIAVFAYIGDTIANATKTFISGGLQGLIDTLRPFIIMCVTLHIMLKGYLQIAGKTDEVLKDVVIHCVIVICITALSLNAANYTTYLIGGVDNWASGLAHSITAAIGNGSTGGESTVFDTLDNLLTSAVDQAKSCFAKMSVWSTESWDWIFAAFAVIITLGAVTLVSGIIIIGSKFLMTLLFLLGPLFLTLACFPATRRFFDSWASKLMENCLVQVFGIAIITLATSIINEFLLENSLGEGDANPLAIAAQIMIVAGIMLFVIRQIPNLSGSLAGGFASGAMTLRDVMKPTQDLAQGAKNISTHAQDFMSRRSEAANEQGNNISRGSTSTSKDAMKRDQLVKDMIAQQTRKNMESNKE